MYLNIACLYTNGMLEGWLVFFDAFLSSLELVVFWNDIIGYIANSLCYNSVLCMQI